MSSYGIDFNKLNSTISFKEGATGQSIQDTITEYGLLSFFSSFQAVSLFKENTIPFTSGNMFWTLPVRSLVEDYKQGHIVKDVPEMDKVQNDEIIQKIASKTVESLDVEAMGFIGVQVYVFQAQALGKVMAQYIDAKCMKILSDFCDQHPEQTIWVKNLGEKKVFTEEEAKAMFSEILFNKEAISKDFTDPHYFGAPMNDFYTIFDTSVLAGLVQTVAFNSAYILAADITHGMIEANSADPASFVKGKLIMTNILNNNYLGAGILDKVENLTMDKLGFLVYKDAFKVSLGQSTFMTLPDPNTQNMKLTLKQQFTTAKLYKNLIFAFVNDFKAGVKGGKVDSYVDNTTTYLANVGQTLDLTSNVILDADKNAVSYASGNASVATVSGNKLVCAAVGTALITATYNKDGTTKTFDFKVKVA